MHPLPKPIDENICVCDSKNVYCRYYITLKGIHTVEKVTGKAHTVTYVEP